VTDTQTSRSNDPQTLALAPAAVMAHLYSAIGQALADAARNAVSAQQQAQVLAQATTTQGIATLYSVDTAALGLATQKILDGR
jgi:hypothetical protein